MAKSTAPATWQRLQAVQTGTIVGAVVIALLYWAQVVFVPLALAVFLTFLLSPPVLALQRRGLGRIPAVVVVVALTALLLAGIGWVVAVQVGNLTEDLPGHTRNIKKKIQAVREFAQESSSGGLGLMVRDIVGEFRPKPAEKGDPAPTQPEAPAGAGATPATGQPPTVVTEPKGTPWLSKLPAVLGMVLEPFGSVALAVVLAVFMLWKREDLRNRFIRLVGHGRISATTKAVDEAGGRISRYLLMQLVVNGTYGLAWGLGLMLIGVDYALLWGFLAAALRYVPYIGAPIAAVLPIALSLIIFEGWVRPTLVVSLLVVLELVSNNIIEPWLYGQSIGVSEVAMLVLAAFWTFLWGPIGLVLSGPLTVCLVVLGRYVPQLEFFDVMLGDAPALEPPVALYQRLLAGDQDEAAQIVRDFAAKVPPEQVYDGLFVPALVQIKRDRERGELDEGREAFIRRAAEEILEDVGERRAAAVAAEAEAVEADQAGSPAPEASDYADDGPRILVLGCPAQDETDRLSLLMLRQLVKPALWDVEVLTTAVLSGELVDRVAEREPAVICIASLPPGGLSHTRFLCKRLKTRFPEVKLLVGRWGLRDDLEQNQEQLRAAGAVDMETTLQGAAAKLNAWRPVLAQPAAQTARKHEKVNKPR